MKDCKSLYECKKEYTKKLSDYLSRVFVSGSLLAYMELADKPVSFNPINEYTIVGGIAATVLLHSSYKLPGIFREWKKYNYLYFKDKQERSERIESYSTTYGEYLYDDSSNTLILFIHMGIPERMKYFWDDIADEIGSEIEEFTRRYKDKHPEKIELNFFIDTEASENKSNLKSLILALDKIDGWLSSAVDMYYLSHKIKRKDYDEYIERKKKVTEIIKNANDINVIINPAYDDQLDTLKDALEKTSRLLVYR